MLAVISEPNRQRILQLVWREEQSAGAIAAQFPITFGAVSQHLRLLRECGAVDLRIQGRTHFYKANRENLGPLAEYLESLWLGRLKTLKTLAEEAELLNKPRN
ncbi:MAG: winged helix-turn-helix transcriptional regulator [Bryobacterales bacterium]|nr:winged helix-turn-helix transcriptional regulator [Bryobacterales bacterium]